MTPRIRVSPVAAALLVASVVVLAINVSLYYPFISDDALISLRYSSRLLDGHGLTWTAGQPVEGYSNLLWVLLVAVMGFAGLDLVFAARLLGLLCSTAILWAVLFTSLRPARVAVDWLPASVALLFVSLSAPIAVWTIGGLEQPLVGALLAASVPLMYLALDAQTPPGAGQRHLLGLSLVLGLLAITRPDGPVFAVVAAATLLLAGPGRWWSRVTGSLVVLCFPALLYGAQLVFRYAYYGELVPNTALVKFAPSAVRRADGLAYLWSGVQALSPFSLIASTAMVGLLALPKYRPKAIYLLALSATWSAYVVVIGGDVFPAFRHLVPLVVVFAFALIELLRFAAQYIAGRPWVTTAAVGLLLVQFISFATGQYAHEQSQRAVTERWEWQCKDLGVFLKTAFAVQQPLLAVTAAGCLPYWSELPSLDMLGLNDYYLPRHPPLDLGTGPIGHELGDGAYVLGREPDIIVFHLGNGPMFRSGTEMAGMSKFQERYVPVTVRIEGLDYAPLIFFDRDSTKIGITRSASVVTVPGFLFRSATSEAYLSRTGTLVTLVVSFALLALGALRIFIG